MQYTLRIYNHTGRGDTDLMSFCLFQNLGKKMPSNGMPLAWMARQCPSGVNVNFSWKTFYSFEWAFTGDLQQGAVFLSSQSLLCDMHSEKDRTELCPVGESYHFCSYTGDTGEGKLTIHCASNIEGNVAVGLGMGGVPVFAAKALSNFTFPFEPDPQPEYRLAFGDFKQGQALVDPMNDSFLIDFTMGHALKIVLDERMNWSAEPILEPAV